MMKDQTFSYQIDKYVETFNQSFPVFIPRDNIDESSH